MHKNWLGNTEIVIVSTYITGARQYVGSKIFTEKSHVDLRQLEVLLSRKFLQLFIFAKTKTDLEIQTLFFFLLLQWPNVDYSVWIVPEDWIM